MEIFSYSENGLVSNRKPDFSRSKRILLRQVRGNSRAKSVAVPLEEKAIPVKFDIKIFTALFVKQMKFAVSYLWLVPAAVILLLAPVLTYKAYSYIQGFARTVDIKDSSSNAEGILLDELTNFALKTDAYYDEAESFGAVSFKDPVVFQNYKVRAGDTIDGIGRRFGLRNFSTLITVNNISNVRVLRAGQILRVPSMDGMIHTVGKGESLSSISAKYEVSVSDLLDVNDLTSEVLSTGQELFIPGACLDKFSLLKAMGELFLNPIKAKFRYTSPFSMRINPVTKVYSHHTGIDLACPTGTPIYSALSGTVMYTGSSNVYGYYVIVKHHDGYQTLYAHMSKILAKKGQYVDQNTKLGLVGSTGQSTGPHLHFSVYKNGKLIDPMSVIKK